VSGPCSPVPLAQLRAELLPLYLPPMRSIGTFYKVRQVLDLLDRQGLVTTADLTPAAVAAWLSRRPALEAPRTTYGLLSYVRLVCNYAAERGWLAVNPFVVRRRWVRKGPTMKAHHHGRAEITRVLELLAAEQEQAEAAARGRLDWSIEGRAAWRAGRLHALAATVAYTGLRKMEALALMTGDIDQAARVLLVVPRRRLKTDASAAPVPIPPPLAPVLAAWLSRCSSAWAFPRSSRDGPWVGGCPGYCPLDCLKAAGRRAGVAGLSFQSLRHSFATHAEFWGLSETAVQRILRHTSVRTQWHYRHADLLNLARLAEGIDYGEAR
jgi:integrase